MKILASKCAARVGLFLVLLSANQAFAGPIVNGDFSDPTDLFGYDVTGTVVSEPTGEFGQLATDGAFLRTLEQTFTIPSDSSILSFDFEFSTELGASGFFVDSFAGSSLTTIDGDFLDILVVDAFGAIPDPSDGIEFLTGALPIDVDYDPTITIPGFTPFPGGTTISGRVSLLLPSDVLGEEATLYFDLFDEFDGAASRVAIDNISIQPNTTAVPEPSSFLLLTIGGGVLIVGARRRNQRKTHTSPLTV